jgi:hypothetical protein
MKAEGVLWGIGNSYRYTYLTPNRDIARSFGSGVLLEVDYEPKGNRFPPHGKRIGESIVDNYQFECPEDVIYEPGMYCWQFSVFIPIPMSQVIIIETW